MHAPFSPRPGEKSLFIPLVAKFYDDFISGEKTNEYRIDGARWNNQTCRPGRRVVISKGYGTHRRAMGFISHYTVEPVGVLHPRLQQSLYELYGSKINEKTLIIGIAIRDLQEIIAPDSRDCRA
jgi:hypothetical protein